MRTITRQLCKVAPYGVLLFLTHLVSYSQVYQNHFQGAYDLGNYEVNYTLIQALDSSYYFVPSSGMNILDSGSYYLSILQVGQDFQPIVVKPLLLNMYLTDSINTMLAYDIIQSRDSSLYICGTVGFNYYFSSDVGFILKIGSYGQGSWLDFYPSVIDLRSIVQTMDNNFVACGSFKRYGDNVQYASLIKINSSGNVLWNREYYADSIWGNSSFNQVITHTDTVIAVGTANNGFCHGDQSDILLVVLNQDGTYINHVAYDRISDSALYTIDYGMTVKFNNNRLWLAGELMGFRSSYNMRDYFVMEVNNNTLNPIWAKKYDISGGYGDGYGEYIQRFLKDNKDSITLTGYEKGNLLMNIYSADAFIVKMDDLGNNPFYNIFGGPHQDYFYKIIKNYDDNLVMGGYSNSFNVNDDVYVVEKYNIVAEHCKDTTMMRQGQKIQYEAIRVRVDSLYVGRIHYKVNFEEYNIHLDTICPKISLDSFYYKNMPNIYTTSNQSIVVGPDGIVELPYGICDYRIFSMNGAMVKSGNKQSLNCLSVSALKPGIYVLHVITDKGETMNIKFIR